MFKIIFYEDKNGYSELREQLNLLAARSVSNKSARIQHKKILLLLELLEEKGTYLPKEFTKHLRNRIWELRPGKNRILYFYFRDKTFVLLHMFQKKTRKTPQIELDRAEREVSDYQSRNGGEKNESNMERI